MDETRLMYWLIKLHEGLARLGPGHAEATGRAFASCTALPAQPAILDIGCGAGAQTLDLARLTSGALTAVDRVHGFLLDLRERAHARGLSARIHPVVADMRQLPFPAAAFDLIWSEGAIYIMGFDAGLASWRALLRARGYLVVSELSWLTDHPPPDLADFWREHYPAMRQVADNLASARALGWEPIDHFSLPHAHWMLDYLGPLQSRLATFRATHANDPEAQAVADLTEQEIAIMANAAGICGYVFYVLRRAD